MSENDGSPHPPSDAQQVAAILRQLGRSITSRKLEFALAFTVTVLVVLTVAFLRPASYVARAAVLIEPSRGSSRSIPDPEDGPTVTSADVTEEEVNSEIAVLMNDEVLRGAVRAARLDLVSLPWYMRIILAPFRFYDRVHAEYHGVQPPTDEDRAVRALSRKISAEPLRASNVMMVTLRSGDPRAAEAILQEILRLYLDHHLKMHSRYAPVGFFNEQLSIMQDSVTRRERELLALKRQLGVTDLVKERDAQLDLDVKLREEASSVSRRLAELDGLLSSHRNTLAEASGPAPARRPVDAPYLGSLKSEVLRLSMEQARLDTRYGDSVPAVIENRKQLELARAALASAEKSVLENSPTLRAVDEDVAKLSAEEEGLRRREVVLNQQLHQSRARLRQLDSALPEAERAERDIRLAERRYEVYLTSSDKSRVELALDRGGLTNVSVVQQPAALSTPEAPKKWVLLLVAVAGGLLTASLVCVLLELRAKGLAGVVHAIAPQPAVA
jgi:polysaccharide biosynthesis protein PslE